MDSFGTRVTTIMVDTLDLDGTVRFWADFLDLKELHRTQTYVYLDRIVDGGPHLGFQLVGEPRPGKNRLHLDIQVSDRAAAAAEIVAAGGAVVGEVDEPGFPMWTVMTDPAGNEFCIYEAEA